MKLVQRLNLVQKLSRAIDFVNKAKIVTAGSPPSYHTYLDGKKDGFETALRWVEEEA